MLAKKPKSPPTKETKAQKFIRAGSGPAAAAAADNGLKRELKPVVINFPVPLLERIDAAAGNMGLNRTAFVILAVNERVLKSERGE